MSLLIDRLAHWAATTPDAPAYRHVDYADDPAGITRSLTWAQVEARARAVAARLRQHAAPGDRAALLLPQGLDYVTAFLGACYARVIAVPLFTPDLPLHGERLRLAYADAEPTTVLTTTAAAAQVEAFLGGVAAPDDLVCVDAVPDEFGRDWRPEPVAADDLAYLQYTSGSTGDPAGVEITHGNITANAAQIWSGVTPTPGDTAMVSWLPLFHDMGLMLTALAPLAHGDYAVFTDPLSFLVRPARWLELAAQPVAVHTAAPNFAYDYCAKRVTDAEKAALDLSTVRVWMNGAEPVRAATIARFTEAFAAAGLRAGSHIPVYGLAEATVFVAGAAPGDDPIATEFDTDALSAGTATTVDSPHRTTLVACGVAHGQTLHVIDPDTGLPCPPGRVGEIRVSGPNVAARYWRDPDRTARVFADGRLRTGDLGVLHDGRLYLTGRLKDLVIVDGRNHYPHDIEATAHEAHPDLRAGRVAAFAVPGDDTEELVVVAEYDGPVPDAVATAVRAAVKARHDLRGTIVIGPPGAVARTSSGKIARQATRARYLAGDPVG